MLTRCPGCATAFRVTPDQLKARQGKVRCGECRHVFNALDSLVEEPAAVVPPVVAVPAPSAPPPAEPDRDEAGDAPVQSADFEPVPMLAPDAVEVPPPEAAPEPELGPELEPELGPEPASFVAEPAAITAAEASPGEDIASPDVSPPALETPDSLPAAASDAEAAAEPLVAPPRPFWVPSYPSVRPRRWPWIVGLLLALLLLSAQALLHFRVELAVLQPGLKPLLRAVCAPFGCDVPRPRRADLLEIETSDLHPDPRHQGLLHLTLTLRNRAPFAQELPHLEVTLTDTADAVLLVRSLPPREYLPAGVDPGQGFAAGELPLDLVLDAGDLPAAGYRLYVYFP